MKVDILAVGVHPDDVELSASGTCIRHIAAGKSLAILDLTEGELGTRGSAELRLKEAEEARQIIGAVERKNVGLADGFFQHDDHNIKKIIPYLRYFRPEIVLINALQDRHPDHGRAAKLVADACFYSGLRKIETRWGEELQTAWRPKAVYHYIQDVQLIPDFVVDISEFWERKILAVKAFSSQFYDPNSKEPSSPISGKDFLDALEGKSRVFGRSINVEYGEGFQVARPIGVNNLFDLY
ncbi:MAG: bacillithiol biosynthesis deacetylase BshB1 [Saprospiraceae bacterium]|nr:bacillithiol biosynthesis deacetylase BshB1 [Saprospiraceae bacterium]